MKAWRPYSGDCPYCGGEPEVLTDCQEEGMAYDGDAARCVDCKLPGFVIICEEGQSADNFISWHDEPDCECGWCKAHMPVSK